MRQVTQRLSEVENGYAIESQGIRFLRELTDREWEDLGFVCSQHVSTGQWIMGDWLLYSEIRGHRAKGLHTYERAMDLTGLSQSCLINYVMVARAYPFSKRVPGASWTRHLLAMKLSEDMRVRIIKQSVDESWKTMRFEETIKRLSEKYLTGATDGVAIGDRVSGPAVRGHRSRANKLPKGVVHGIKCPFCDNIIPKARIHTYKVEEGTPSGRSKENTTRKHESQESAQKNGR